MPKRQLLAKKNRDGSYSVSYPAGALVKDAFVDFYDEKTGSGFQRKETTRNTRGRQIADYIKRCVENEVEPKLFEMTANARVTKSSRASGWRYEPLDDAHPVGFLLLKGKARGEWLSVIDGGTRLRGIQYALDDSLIDENQEFDVRIFVDQSLAEEIAQFLLINDRQKKVRTDLGLRVVQRLQDDGELTDEQMILLETAVPKQDAWKFQATRITARLNSDTDSPWKNRIQMPHEGPKATTLQSFFSSLQPILKDADIMEQLKSNDVGWDETEAVCRILKNFWSAVAEVNPMANDEPLTSVLWRPIGSSACHIGLAPIVKTILESSELDVTKDRFVKIITESPVSEYEYWFTQKGRKPEDYYPSEKGEATLMTGAANYKRLGNDLEEHWRRNLHSNPSGRSIRF